jgi:hypothetical protein
MGVVFRPIAAGFWSVGQHGNIVCSGAPGEQDMRHGFVIKRSNCAFISQKPQVQKAADMTGIRGNIWIQQITG